VPTLITRVVLSHFAAGAVGELQWSNVSDAFAVATWSQLLTSNTTAVMAESQGFRFYRLLTLNGSFGLAALTIDQAVVMRTPPTFASSSSLPVLSIASRMSTSSGMSLGERVGIIVGGVVCVIVLVVVVVVVVLARRRARKSATTSTKMTELQPANTSASSLPTYQQVPRSSDAGDSFGLPRASGAQTVGTYMPTTDSRDSYQPLALKPTQSVASIYAAAPNPSAALESYGTLQTVPASDLPGEYLPLTTNDPARPYVPLNTGNNNGGAYVGINAGNAQGHAYVPLHANEQPPPLAGLPYQGRPYVNSYISAAPVSYVTIDGNAATGSNER